MTLDTAIDSFRQSPTKQTAMRLAKVAKEYSDNEMIGSDSTAAIAVELESHGFKYAMLELMK